MGKTRINNLNIENAKIIFRNFAGIESKFNRKGNRNFGVIIDDPKTAEELAEIGWNVKILNPRDEDDEVRHFLKVTVRFDNFPPNVYMIMSNTHRKVELDEDSIASLDYADIISADLIITPYIWQVQDKEGIAAYLKTMYVVINEDEFADKYSDYK